MLLRLTFATLLLATAARPQTPPHLYTFSHPAMATIYTLSLYSPNKAQAQTLADEAFDEIDRIEQLLSNYRASSELSRINHEAALAPVTVDPEMFSFLSQARHWSQVSDGAFDLTVGPLMHAWGFYRHAGAVPPPAALAALRPVVGWQNFELDPATRTVHFTTPGVELDPGGIGKGFAVDAAVQFLRAAGVHAALLSAGSSTLYGLGAPPGRPGWRVIVPGPLPSHHTLSTVYLRDTSLSSADCTQKNFTVAGHLYCHIMDPLTLRPVEGRIQVTILNPSATASDALSNVIFVQAPAQSLLTLRTSAPISQALIVSNPHGTPTYTTYQWPFRLNRLPPR